LSRSNVVSLQNGIGNEEIIAEYTEHVIGGTIITGFEWRGDGWVEVTVEAGPIRLGRYPEGVGGEVVGLADLFRAAGLQVEENERIKSSLWAKTLYNCALNPLGAIAGVSYGRLSAAPAWAVIEQLVAEAFAVCEAEAVSLPWDSADGYLDYLLRVQLPATAGHHSSMLQDIRKGRSTEIDFMNGAIGRLGRRHGIPTPVNDTLVNLILFKTGDGTAVDL
jgi:2-dehydropantoate 2-reductase